MRRVSQSTEGDSMGDDGRRKTSWRERRKAAKRAKAERTGDSPEKSAAHERRSADPDVKGAASSASLGGTLSGGGF
jgi:hypothetical protein